MTKLLQIAPRKFSNTTSQVYSSQNGAVSTYTLKLKLEGWGWLPSNSGL